MEIKIPFNFKDLKIGDFIQDITGKVYIYKKYERTVIHSICVETFEGLCKYYTINGYKYDINHPSIFDLKYIIKKNKNMELKDLKSGMIVETSEGYRYLVLLQNEVIVRETGFIPLNGYNKDLTHKEYKDFSINKVYNAKIETLNTIFQSESLKLLWERPKTTELTMQEIADKFDIPIEQLKIKK